MLSRQQAIEYILSKHGDNAVYISSTGYISRAVHDLTRGQHNVFYMQGSMGIAPSIGAGIASNSTKPVVVISGDAALLMHLGVTHTIRDLNLPNLFTYVLDNGCHESVGGYEAAALEKEYNGITEIIKISRDGKCPRVELSPVENTHNIKKILQTAT
tara:strand:- start:6851 stop:7321 length:471 start_codon:yes stop_codon:yes gene_type:complete